MKENDHIKRVVESAKNTASCLEVQVATLNKHLERIKKIIDVSFPLKAFRISQTINTDLETIYIKEFESRLNGIFCKYRIEGGTIDFSTSLSETLLSSEELNVYEKNKREKKLLDIQMEIEKQKDIICSANLNVERLELSKKIIEESF